MSAAPLSTSEFPPVPDVWTRTTRRQWVDQLIDELYDRGFTREMIFEDHKVAGVLDMMPHYRRDEYFQISLAWADFAPWAIALAKEQFSQVDNMWEYQKRLAASCIVLRMRARSRPLYTPIDRSTWHYLGSMMGPTGLLDLWGSTDWVTVQIRWKDGEFEANEDYNDDFLRAQIHEALRRLDLINLGPNA